MASKLMKSYCSIIGGAFLKRVLGGILSFLYLADFLDMISEICAHPIVDGVSFEVDPEKISSSENLEKNQERLQLWCSKLLRRIYDMQDETPSEFRKICNTLQKKVAAKFPESAQTCIGGFMFLRYFCPAVVAPKGFGLIKGTKFIYLCTLTTE